MFMLSPYVYHSNGVTSVVHILSYFKERELCSVSFMDINVPRKTPSTFVT